MKLYYDKDPAPNPRRVTIFLREKGIELPLQQVSLIKAEHRAPEYLAKNSLGQVPALELDDGTVICESVSICRYLEELHPDPPLFGRSARERALVDMWMRRTELKIMLPVGMVWVHAHPFTAAYAAARGRKQYTEFGEANVGECAAIFRWLDRELEGREFIVGDAYSMADIVALTTIDFAQLIGIDVAPENGCLRAWHTRVSARPSAAMDLTNVPVESFRRRT